ncbi:hypothetical protein F5883DRAFT_526333 [Diaporthe sp. PMI_573]|nr:hypothetical protein F5883DRAFT_526333 [Diaporthaceae sp. PMI_573]
MSLTPVVKQRLAQGQTAAGGAYVELIDMDEVERLTDAYLTLNDGKQVSEQQPPPLTPQDFKRYVRLVHDALKSTDQANDAFKVNKDGNTCKTPPMNYIDALKMFEIQLVAGNLVKTVHGAQSGTIRTPSWPLVNGVKFHKYSTFPERMDKVILALKTWKSFGKALFLDFVPMEKRLAIQPEEETTKKGFDKSNNGNRDIELQFARRNMPRAEKPAAAANDDDGEGEDEDANNDRNPGPVNKKRRRGGNPDSVTISPGVYRGNNRGVKKQAAAPTASASTNASGSIQPASSAHSASDDAIGSIQPAASAASATNNTVGSIRTSTATGAVFRPTNRHVQPSSPSYDKKIADSDQTATPVGASGDGPSQSNINAAFVGQQAAAQDVLAYMRSASQGLDDRSRFPGPLENSMRQYGNQRPQMAGPSTIQRPLPSGERLLPEQPQPAQFPSRSSTQQYPPPPDYATSQQAAYGFQQNNPLRGGFPQANQQSRMQGAQDTPAQSPRHYQAPQPSEVTAINNSNLLGQTISPQNEGQVVHFQENGQMTGSGNTGSTVVYTSGGVVNNYFQLHTPSPPGGQALASPHNGNNQAPDNYFSRGNFQNQDNNQDAGNVSFHRPHPSCIVSLQQIQEGNSAPASPRGYSSSDFPTVNPKVEQQDQEGSPLPALHPSNSPLPAALPALAADDAPGALNAVRPNDQVSWPDIAPVASPPGAIWGDEDVYQMYFQMGIAPPRAGNVFEGELRTMFRTPSPRQESSEAETEEEEEEDDDESEEDSDDEIKQDSDDELKSESKDEVKEESDDDLKSESHDEVKEESDVKVKFEEDSNDGS